jgi:hypothetical protein
MTENVSPCENESHREACWSMLKGRLEMGVSVKLLDGSVRAGFVYAVDPQVPCALILVKVKYIFSKYASSFQTNYLIIAFSQRDDGEPEKWGITAVFAHGIASCEGCSIVNDFSPALHVTSKPLRKTR